MTFTNYGLKKNGLGHSIRKYDFHFFPNEKKPICRLNQGKWKEEFYCIGVPFHS